MSPEARLHALSMLPSLESKEDGLQAGLGDAAHLTADLESQVRQHLPQAWFLWTYYDYSPPGSQGLKLVYVWGVGEGGGSGSRAKKENIFIQ